MAEIQAGLIPKGVRAPSIPLPQAPLLLATRTDPTDPRLALRTHLNLGLKVLKDSWRV